MSDANWIKWNLETFPGGASSAVSPDLLPQNQTAWGMNASFRGAKIQTRPNIACRMFLPSGLVQGASYFSVQGGMIVTMIHGRPYRLRIGENTFSYEPILLPWWNSGIIKQVWFQQTVETLVIQDGQSNAILYNGSTAVRAVANEVPRGRMMAYGNGRLWVAINANELVAGDIRTRVAGSELKFTETNYLSGGGALWFQKPMTGLAFIPVTGTSDYGTLLVFGRANCESVRADITDRDAWRTYPGFVSNVLRSIGAASDWGLTEVNQDLFWRDGLGQLRSLRAAIQQESGPGNSSLSREVSRLVDFDSQQLLGWSSGIYFDNRFLMTSSPFLNLQGGVSFRDLMSLDFAPISTMQGKSPPAYNGSWQGVNWTQLISGEFNRKIRAFGISSDDDGINRLWEFATNNVSDVSLACEEEEISTEIPIEAFVEYPRVDFNDPKKWKRLTRLDVWLSNIFGEITLTAYWRSDNNQKWTQWQDTIEECAIMTDPATTAPHVWKNLLPQQRPLLKSFSIPDEIDDISKYALANGFGFQIRLKWTGSLRIERAVLSAIPQIDDPDYVDRAGQEADCVENNITGNEIVYKIPIFSGCPEIELSQGSGLGSLIPYGSTYEFPDAIVGTPEDVVFTITNNGGGPLEIGTLTVVGESEFQLLGQPEETLLLPGESTTFSVRLRALHEGVFSGAVVAIPTNQSSPSIFTFNLSGTVTGAIVAGYTYEGQMKWFGYLPYDYSGTDGLIPIRFLNRSAGGTNQSIQSLGGRAPSTGTSGTTSKIIGGSETISAIDGTQTGEIFSTDTLTGVLCRGSSYAYLSVPLMIHSVTTGSVDDVIGQNAFITAKGLAGRSQRVWIGSEQAGPGYGITYCGAGINGVNGGRMTETLSTQMTLAQAAAAGGAVLIPVTLDSQIDAYDPLTGISHGRVTQLNFTYPTINPAGFYLVEVVLTQQLIVGGPVVTLTDTISVDSGINQPLDLDYIIPQKIGYVTTFSFVRVSTFSQDGDDFEQQPQDWYSGISQNYIPQSTWTVAPFFGMLAPYTMCGCDWEDFPTEQIGPPLSSDVYGYYWSSTGIFFARDNTQAGDDFETYAVGEILTLTMGNGFPTPGRMLVFDNFLTKDDFESYATGTITLLSYGTGDAPSNCWTVDGTFSAIDNLLAFDDFETYSTGTIINLTFGTGGSPSNCWNANGTFG